MGADDALRDPKALSREAAVDGQRIVIVDEGNVPGGLARIATKAPWR
jgi:hypothetical protein